MELKQLRKVYNYYVGLNVDWLCILIAFLQVFLKVIVISILPFVVDVRLSVIILFCVYQDQKACSGCDSDSAWRELASDS